jgi:hypothetical protein
MHCHALAYIGSLELNLYHTDRQLF